MTLKLINFLLLLLILGICLLGIQYDLTIKI